MTSHLNIDVAITDEVWSSAGLDLDAICAAAISSVETSLIRKDASELSIAFVDDAAIQVLNQTYRDKDKPTNVLSFPMDGPMLGDIVLARETIVAEAALQSKTLPDHLSHLIIHGLLHLLGYDHETDEQAAEMESLEINALKRLGIDNPYDFPDLGAETK